MEGDHFSVRDTRHKFGSGFKTVEVDTLRGNFPGRIFFVFRIVGDRLARNVKGIEFFTRNGIAIKPTLILPLSKTVTKVERGNISRCNAICIAVNNSTGSMDRPQKMRSNKSSHTGSSRNVVKSPLTLD